MLVRQVCNLSKFIRWLHFSQPSFYACVPPYCDGCIKPPFPCSRPSPTTSSRKPSKYKQGFGRTTAEGYWHQCWSSRFDGCLQVNLLLKFRAMLG